MVRSIIRFQVKPGREADFGSAFHRTGMLTRPRGIVGFLDAELSHSVDNVGDYLVVARWESAESYRAWQEEALIGAPPDALDDLFDTLIDPQAGSLYAIISTGEP